MLAILLVTIGHQTIGIQKGGVISVALVFRRSNPKYPEQKYQISQASSQISKVKCPADNNQYSEEECDIGSPGIQKGYLDIRIRLACWNNTKHISQQILKGEHSNPKIQTQNSTTTNPDPDPEVKKSKYPKAKMFQIWRSQIKFKCKRKYKIQRKHCNTRLRASLYIGIWQLELSCGFHSIRGLTFDAQDDDDLDPQSMESQYQESGSEQLLMLNCSG